MTIRSTLKSVTAAAAIAFAATTLAQAGSVSLDGYDLGNAADVDRLHQEIVSAVKRECVSNLRTGSTHGVPYHVVRKCIQEAVDQTVTEAGIAPLSYHHASIAEGKRYVAGRPGPTDTTIAVK